MSFSSRTHPPWQRLRTERPVYDSKLLIAVMGATGSGKSRFIKLGTGKNVVIGHGLESCTSGIQEVDVQIDEKTVTLIDTPGFDDTNKTDTDVLTAIANYLESNYRQNHRLTGVIFLHRITDNRMGGVSNKNILMFQKLVGSAALDHVICCSTMWDRAEESAGEFASREDQLRNRYWANMVANGAQMVRHNNTTQSARSVIARLIFKQPVALEIQRELVDQQKKLSETSAGVEVNREMGRIKKMHEKELKETREAFEMMRAEDNERMVRLLAEETTMLELKLQEAHAARARLDADRRAELKRLQDRIVEVEAKEAEARQRSESEIANIRVQTQSASFGIALRIPYDPSKSSHKGRPIYEDVEGAYVRGGWLVLVTRGNWPTRTVSSDFHHLYDSSCPDLSNVSVEIYMFRGVRHDTAFVWAPDGRLYAGFTKIGELSANMSCRQGLLKSVQRGSAYQWRNDLTVNLSIVSHSLRGWISYNHKGRTTSTETIVLKDL